MESAAGLVAPADPVVDHGSYPATSVLVVAEDGIVVLDLARSCQDRGNSVH